MPLPTEAEMIYCMMVGLPVGVERAENVIKTDTRDDEGYLVGEEYTGDIDGVPTTIRRTVSWDKTERVQTPVESDWEII